MTGPSGRGLTFRSRLLLAQAVVVAAGVLTAAVVAAFVGPPLFHEHLVQAGHGSTGPELTHIETAFRDANIIALSTAAVIAVVAGSVVTWFLARAVTRPLHLLVDAATRLSRGDFTARLPDLSAGPELSQVTATFNAVARQLQTTEDTRRRLLTDLAHEMRTPLATLGTYIDALDDGMTTWTTDTSRVVHEQQTRLLRLAHDISEVSRAEEGRLELHIAPFSPAEAITTAVGAARPAYSAKGVTLTARMLAPATTLVDGDVARIEQVLDNLLRNALRHTPRGGTVTVTVAPGSAEVTDPRSAPTPATTVQFTVTDTGEGIPGEQLPHIFERFYRGDTARNRDQAGSGIGLTISRGIATSHHGTLQGHSNGPGTGATFTLTLPTTVTQP